MFRTVRNLSQKNRCRCCLTYWTEGIVYCDCGTCLVPTDLTRKLNRERLDALTILNFVIEKGGSRGARHGQSEVQREHHQANVCFRKAHKNGFNTFLQRFQGDVKLPEVRNEISDEMVSFASTRTKLHKKTTHTSPLGKNDKTTKRDGHCV